MNTDQLTFTRFIAAISIVIYHFGGWVFPFDRGILKIVFQNASLGVSYFFLLSGFVMIVAYWKRYELINFKGYIKNRVARILPLYYFAFFLMLIYYFIRIHILSTSSNYKPTLVDAFLNILLVQSWFLNKATTINPAAWSLSVEAFFYLIFPFLFNRFFKKKAGITVALSVITFFIISQIVFHFLIHNYQTLEGYFKFLPVLHVNEFFAGNLLGLIFIKKGGPPLKGNTLQIIGIIFICILAISFPISGLIYHNGLFVVLFAPLLYFIASDNGIIARLFRKKILIYLGEISFGVYLLQFPVYFFFTATLTFFHHKINQPLFYVFLVILVITSGISYNLIEQPLRRKIRNW